MTADQMIDMLRDIDRRLWWINDLAQSMNETIDNDERARLQGAALREIERLYNDTERLYRRAGRLIGRRGLQKAS